jgi:hypothetical protein
MSGGFALVAWPAAYDVTGVMTFIVNQDGIVRERPNSGAAHRRRGTSHDRAQSGRILAPDPVMAAPGDGSR